MLSYFSDNLMKNIVVLIAISSSYFISLLTCNNDFFIKYDTTAIFIVSIFITKAVWFFIYLCASISIGKLEIIMLKKKLVETPFENFQNSFYVLYISTIIVLFANYFTKGIHNDYIFFYIPLLQIQLLFYVLLTFTKILRINSL